MKTENYIQCHLRKHDRNHMAWIPEKFAVVGKFIKIKNDNDTWDDGWEVIGNGGGLKKPYAEVNALSQLHKKTRKASDI